MTFTKPTRTREDWLIDSVEELRKLFKTVDLNVPEVHVACGFPSVRGLNGRLGECWNASSCKDGLHQIFVSPLVSQSVKALEVLTHELLHASLPEDVKHGKEFKEAMTVVGLEGPPKSTWAGEKLKLQLEEINERIGDYPNAGLEPKEKKHDSKQTTRMRKLICKANKVHESDYIVRASSKVISIGLPSCPCGAEMSVADEELEEK